MPGSNPNDDDFATVQRGPAWTQDPAADPVRLNAINGDPDPLDNPEHTGWGVAGAQSTLAAHTGSGWRRMIAGLKLDGRW